MKTFLSFLKKNAAWILGVLSCLFIMMLMMELNQVSIAEWKYGALLCVFILVVIGAEEYIRYLGKHKKLRKLQNVIQISVEAMDFPRDVLEEDYQELIRVVHENKITQINSLEKSRTDMMEYYTMWVHQIKTPMAAMKLLLQAEDTFENRELLGELFRIEQYVEMALNYVRLDADTTDFILKRYELDKIVREAVRKYAPLFIRKKISLTYEPLDVQVLTDEKWLEFVIEQVLSNAIKYTKSGSISIYIKQEEQVLVIEDTGIGIRSEDLPRILEKGYTGYNGHIDKRSTGIGLYLCNRILKKLSHTLRVESKMGKGTKVLIGLSVQERTYE